MKSGLFLLCFIFCLSSCIKEDVSECLPQYEVQLFVKDKNYLNEVLQPVDENLPFRQYVNNIYYVLHNNETGENIYSSQYISIQGDEKKLLLTFNDIPNGHFDLTVWGNLPDISAVSGLTFNLHLNGAESTDMYMGTTTLTSNKPAALLGLERVKGKLQLICKNFPDSITKLDIRISSISQHVKNDFTYSDTIVVKKTFNLTGTVDPIFETYLAPTYYGNKSGLTLAVYANNNSQPLFTTASINTLIKRNEVTKIGINYNDVSHMWEIWILNGDEWTKAYQLDITNFSKHLDLHASGV